MLIYNANERRQFDGELYYPSGWASVKSGIVVNPKFKQRVVRGYDSSGKVLGYIVYRRRKRKGSAR